MVNLKMSILLNKDKLYKSKKTIKRNRKNED